MSTKIPWAKETINPWVGCTKVREGCKNCYAERLAYRLAAMGQENYASVLDRRRWNGKIILQMEQLEKLEHWHKGRRVFIGSMTDIFHEVVSFHEIVRVFDAMYANMQHTYIIATKRPDKALAFSEWWMAEHHWAGGWAGHIHLLISCSTQKDLDEMAPVLFQIPAAVRGVSLEPLIEEVDISQYLPDIQIAGVEMEKWLDWAVVGCESGPRRRPCNIEWVRSIVQQCKETDVPVFVKQLDIGGKVASDPKDFPEDLRIRQYPEQLKAGGKT